MNEHDQEFAPVDVEALGWQRRWVGELDHRELKAPSLKLRSAHRGDHGDVVYSVDFRVSLPNQDSRPSSAELHSLEHFLLEGLQRSLPKSFVSVGLMGCQTGFYLVFLNEGRADVLCTELESILTNLLNACEVPYQRIDQCGRYRNHDLRHAQALAQHVLRARKRWLEAA